MKPLHIGLLVVGAALAGALAITMTQPLPVPVLHPNSVKPTAVKSNGVKPAGVAPNTPPPVVANVQVKKPSPIPDVQRARSDAAVRAAAPDPVYEQADTESKKTAIRKNKPNLVASLKPTQWIPGRYDSSADPLPARQSLPPAAAPAVPPAVEKNPSPAPLPAVEHDESPAPHRHATLETGMAIPIRLDETLSSDFSRAGGTFQGSLVEPLVADGFVIAERGARVTGRIVDSQKAGRSAGMSRLELGLTHVTTSDGQRVSISTEPWMNLGDSIPSKTVIRFRLTSKVTITEQQIAGK